MKILTFDTREEWDEARLCKITGSKLKDVITKRGSGTKVGVYQLIADRLAEPADGENAMDRGTRLESEAIEQFEDKTGLQVDQSLVMWTRDDNDNIAISPDGFEKDVPVVTWGVEVKCLGSARHIEAALTGKVPSDYDDQKLQYFIVNDDLQKLYFVMYDPRLLVRKLIIIEVLRSDVQDEVDSYLAKERQILAQVEETVKELMAEL